MVCLGCCGRQVFGQCSGVLRVTTFYHGWRHAQKYRIQSQKVCLSSAGWGGGGGIHDGGQLSKNVPFRSVSAHIFETSGWNNITFGSQGDIGIIHSFSDFDLGMIPCDRELFGGGGLSRKTF